MADPRAEAMPALSAPALRGTRGVDLTVWPPRYDRAYRPAAAAEHWLPEVECAEPAARDALVFAKLTRQVRYAWERSAFYRSRWREAGVSPETLIGGEFQVIVSRGEAMDELLIRAEYTAGHASAARIDALRATMRERLRARLGVHPRVDLVPEGTLPRTEFKARRVIDDRDLYRQGLRTGDPPHV